MRIALACAYAWDAPGGVQVHVGQLARHLRERGHDVLVLAPSRNRPTERHVVPAGRPIRVPYNGSIAPIAPWPGSARLVRRALASFRPDVTHVHEPLVPGTAMFAALASPAPVVATFHAHAERAALFSLAAPLLRPVWRRLTVRLAVSRAAGSYVGDRFRHTGIRIVPNGVEVEAFEGASPAPLPEGRRVLFVNRLDRRKGFAVMVEAFRMLASTHPDALLVVAGDGVERRAVGRLPEPLRRRVVLLGTVPHPRLPPYHVACETFCAPATGGESFGIVLIEAMAAGLPVVASDIAGYREVVRDGVDGLLTPPGDARAIAAALRRILDDPDLAKRFSEAGIERARRFSWNTVAGEVEAIYREVAPGR